jgi:adenylate cyclase
MDTHLAYMPKDRQKALCTSKPLPEQTQGTALFADISGFTPLTEGLAKSLGARRGAEELAKRLNQVYDVLIAEIHAYGGSVIGFSGDAVTCWFDDIDGNEAGRALTCGLALQDAIQLFDAIELPDGNVSGLALRVGIASGIARRFFVGDPNIQLIDTLAGATIDRMATAQTIGNIGDVMIDEATQAKLGDKVTVSSWETTDMGRFGVASVQTNTCLASPNTSIQYVLSDEQTRVWIQPTVYERLNQGHGEFLTELRPATALFIGFDGIDYEDDPDAGKKLDRFIQEVQVVLEQYEGTFIQLTIGDKGSYMYAAFGAPLAHEDDALRAVYSALGIRKIAESLGYVTHLRMGITQGTMRTGAYGSKTRRTYGVLGDDVNIAARLMQYTADGSIAGSGRVQAQTADRFAWKPLQPIIVKGKSEPMPVALLIGERERRLTFAREAEYALPMVGRQQDLTIIEDRLTKAIGGEGQIIGIVAEAGMGKSRLVKEVINLARQHGIEETAFLGECPSYGTTTPYLVWQSLAHQFFKISDVPSENVHQYVTAFVQDLAPEHMQNLPLLEAVLNVGLLPNDFTRKLDGQTGRHLRHTLLCAILEAQPQPRVIILEDTHWIDPLSRELLETIASSIATLPILLVMAYRPTTAENSWLSKVEALPNFTSIALEVLTESETEQLIQNKLKDHASQEANHVPESLVTRVLERAEGNPFYIEEFINYLQDQNISLESAATMAESVLPSSLHSLILSRIDKLTEQQKITLKVASIIGRIFSLSWVHGYYPALGNEKQIKENLGSLAHLDLTPLDTPEPNLTYLFKHIVTQEVTYESLSYEVRLQLHGQFAAYLEQHTEVATNLGLITYHYERSTNLKKQFHYLHVAGEEAFDLYALDNAVAYFDKALTLLKTYNDDIGLSRDEWLTVAQDVFIKRGRALEYQSQFVDALKNYARMTDFAETYNYLPMALWAMIAKATIYGTWTTEFEPEKSIELSEQALELAKQLGDHAAEAKIYWNLLLALSLSKGDKLRAVEYGDISLAIARKHGLKEQEAFTLNNLGLAYMYVNDYEKGKITLKAVSDLWIELGNMPMLADSYAIMTVLCMMQGDLQQSLSYATLAYDVSKKIGVRWNELSAAAVSADGLCQLGEFGNALRFARIAEQGYSEVSSREQIWWSQGILAFILFEHGATDLALEYADKVLNAYMIQKPENVFGLYGILQHCPVIYASQGNIKQLKNIINLARAYISENPPESYNTVLLARAEAELKLIMQDYESLIDMIKDVIRQLLDSDNQSFLVELYWLQARAEFQLGHFGAAKDTLTIALENSYQLGERRIRWRVLDLLSQIATQQGDPQTATTLRNEARDVIIYIRDQIDDSDFLESFVNRPDIALILT